MKAIYKILGITQQQYEDIVLQLFIKWSQQQCVRCTDWQKLIANSSINKWFLSELQHLENNFKDEIKGYINATHIDRAEFQNIYISCTKPILKLYPKPLIEQARKGKECKTFETYEGVKVFNYLLRN